jgi:D-alanyl-D-alanine carboxypeptidase
MVRSNGRMIDATGWYRGGIGASGGIIANAADEAHFLTALMRGKLLPPAELAAMKTAPPNGGNYALGLAVTTLACGSRLYNVFDHLGANYQTMSIEYVSGDGSRVVVILANARDPAAPGQPNRGLDNLVAAATRLFCMR